MGRLLNRKLNQTLVYWAPKSVDEFGQRTLYSPTTITCRYRHGAFLTVDNQGKQLVASIRILCLTALQREGWVYVGTIAQAGNLSPQELGASEIVQVNSITNVKGGDPFYTILAGR